MVPCATLRAVGGAFCFFFLCFAAELFSGSSESVCLCFSYGALSCKCRRGLLLGDFAMLELNKFVTAFDDDVDRNGEFMIFWF